MSQQYFLCTAQVQPTKRWSTAFPRGMAGERNQIVSRAGAGDLVWVPTALHGWESELEWLSQRLAGGHLAVISLDPDDDEGLRALGGGARAYCHALSAPESFREVAEAVRLGGLWIGPGLLGRVVGAARRGLVATDSGSLRAVLSPRELEVARAAADGASNRGIADALGITERTVKAHMGAIFEKLGVRDRLQLVLRLSRQGSFERVG